MKSTIKIGTTREERFVVSAQHTIDFASGGMPEILSTPSLVAVLERSARMAIFPSLETDESSVGVDIKIQHIAPTPLGKEVQCRARVYSVEKNLISFQIEAFDELEQIAKGTHKRRVVKTSRLAKRVDAKR